MTANKPPQKRRRRPEAAKHTGTHVPKSQWKMKRIPPEADELIHKTSQNMRMAEQQIFMWIFRHGLHPDTTAAELETLIRKDMETVFADLYSRGYMVEEHDETTR